jgi:hypothetical protein
MVPGLQITANPQGEGNIPSLNEDALRFSMSCSLQNVCPEFSAGASCAYKVPVDMCSIETFDRCSAGPLMCCGWYSDRRLARWTVHSDRRPSRPLASFWCHYSFFLSPPSTFKAVRAIPINTTWDQ